MYATVSTAGAASPSVAPLSPEGSMQQQPEPSMSLPPISENGATELPEISQGGSASAQPRTPLRAAPSASFGTRTTGLPTTGRPNRVGRADIDEDETDTMDGDNTVIWGTSINAEVLRNKINRFLNHYRDADEVDGIEDAKYFTLVKQAAEDRETVVNVDTADIRASDRMLYSWLVNYPREVLPIFDDIVKDIQLGAVVYGPHDTPPDIICRPFNLEEKKTIRDLDPSDVDKLICVEGMVTRTSPIIPDIRTGYFRCERCQMVAEVAICGGKVDEPEKCNSCGSKWTNALIHNLCSFTDKQLVKMQERPNDIPEGETPHAVSLFVFESNVDVCRPGDRVTITGTFRAAPMRVNPRQRAMHALFKTHIDCNHIQRDENSRLFSLAGKEAEAAAAAAAAEAKEAPGASQGASQSAFPVGTATSAPDMTPEGGGFTQDDQFVALGNMSHEEIKAREKQIRTLAEDPRLYERMVASMAPNIWEMDDIKKGLLCQLFGGSTKTFPGGRIRGEINVLMCGDPSTSKSQLLSYVHALAPRGIYTSGKGSSAVGLTAYVTRDPDTKEMVLESGALVLSDKGVCCIDEFDKMSDSARSMLHEAMEQQTVSVAKAGLISTLNARTSVCACANPIGSRYNPNLSVSENIALPPTLLTRFDLIYLVLDKFDEERDRRLARHLVSLYYEGAQTRELSPDVIPKDLLQDYIAFSRARINPKITDEACSALVDAYRELRRDGRERKVIVATPRQLESLIRLSEALARLHLKETVGVQEVQEATRLWYTAMSGSAASGDGVIDMDNIITGSSTATREFVTKGLPDMMRTILKNQTVPMSVGDMVDLLKKNKVKVNTQHVIDVLRQLDDAATFDENLGVIKPIRAAAV
eukprot:gene7906-1118_t